MSETASLIFPPWGETTVAALNDYQRGGWMHPFTCGTDSQHPVLIADPLGWTCSACNYTQSWAHTFMGDRDSWPNFGGGDE